MYTRLGYHSKVPRRLQYLFHTAEATTKKTIFDRSFTPAVELVLQVNMHMYSIVLVIAFNVPFGPYLLPLQIEGSTHHGFIADQTLSARDIST